MVEDDPAIVKICIDCLRPLAEAANTINVSKPPGAPEEWLRHTTYRQNRQN